MIRTAWVYLVGWAATLYFGLDVILRSLLAPGTLPRRCPRAERGWSRTILWAAGVKVEYSGLDRVALDGAQILVANHESWFDVFALAGYLPVSAKFVAKKELEKVPFFGSAWVACDHVSIDRGDRSSAIQSLRAVGQRIRDAGISVLVFPEGTRTRTGELQPFKKGAFVLALEAGVPVLPIGISGSRDIMPKGSVRIRSGTIRVRVGEPIVTDGMSPGDRDRLMDDAREAVARLRLPGDIGSVPEGGPEGGSTLRGG